MMIKLQHWKSLSCLKPTKDFVDKKHIKMDTIRRCQVKLLDDKIIELTVNAKQSISEMIDEIARQYNLTETEYFGLYYEETDERFWLPAEKKLFDQEIFKRETCPLLYFGVRFVFKSFMWLQSPTAVLLFFFYTRFAIYRGTIDTNDDTLFQLAGLVVQAIAGDYTSDEVAVETIKRAGVLPKRVVERNTSRKYCEDQIIIHYKSCKDLMRGLCIVKYMMMAENLPMYGTHYFPVRNKSNVLAWLGISFVGISVYDYHDRENPLKIYYWRSLENLYYRDRKFSLEVHDLESSNSAPSLTSTGYTPASASTTATESDDKLIDAIHDPSTQMSAGRRANTTPNIKVRAWFTNSPQFCKAIWSMAVAQHQFYLDKRNCRHNQSLTINDLVRELSHSTLTLSIDNALQNGSLSRSNSAVTTLEQNEQVAADVQQLIDLMKQRKQHFEKILNDKLQGFNQLCLMEKQLTGIPSDDFVQVNSSESQDSKSKSMDELLNEQEQEFIKLNQLKQEHGIQSKIVDTAKKLLHDQATGNKNLLDSVLKQRFEFYSCVKEKLERLTKLIDTTQKELASRYPHHNTTAKSSSLNIINSAIQNSSSHSQNFAPTQKSSSSSPNSITNQQRSQTKSPSPTLHRTSSYKRALVNTQRNVPTATSESHLVTDDQLLQPNLDRSHSSDVISVVGLPPESSAIFNRQHNQQFSTVLMPPASTSSSSTSASVRNRVRDRKQQSSVRHGQKVNNKQDVSHTETVTTPDDATPTNIATTNMRSLDRRHVRVVGGSKPPMQPNPSTIDIYGSLERNKHKVSTPTLGIDALQHDFYHLSTSTNDLAVQQQTPVHTTSTIVTTGNAIHQNSDLVDNSRSRRAPQTQKPMTAVFQPHYDRLDICTTTPSTYPQHHYQPQNPGTVGVSNNLIDNSYYTISGETGQKHVSSHNNNQNRRRHNDVRYLVGDNFYQKSTEQNYPSHQKPLTMHHYETSPLLVRRPNVDHLYPQTRTNFQQQHSSNHPNNTQNQRHISPSFQQQQHRIMNGGLNQRPTGQQASSSSLLFRPHSSQSSSSHSSGPTRLESNSSMNSNSFHVADEFSDDMMLWLATTHGGNSATLV